jgi:hypothetical protein
MDLATSRAQAQFVAPAINREGARTPPSPGLAKIWPQWPRSWTCYPHPPPTGWIGCTTSWGKSSTLSLHSRWSAPSSVGSGSQPLARTAPGLAGGRLPRDPPRQGRLPHRLGFHPKACQGDMGVQPKRQGHGRACAKVDTVTERDTVVVLRDRGHDARGGVRDTQQLSCL